MMFRVLTGGVCVWLALLWGPWVLTVFGNHDVKSAGWWCVFSVCIVVGSDGAGRDMSLHSVVKVRSGSHSHPGFHLRFSKKLSTDVPAVCGGLSC